jgi:hypothetical protein
LGVFGRGYAGWRRRGKSVFKNRHRGLLRRHHLTGCGNRMPFCTRGQMRGITDPEKRHLMPDGLPGFQRDFRADAGRLSTAERNRCAQGMRHFSIIRASDIN